MRNKLNPDGARIRILRIQRGWTQEQLAEISGVSPRTIQRAETANGASFDTVRAIAGAFGTDFDQLLKPEACSASDPEPQISNLAHVPSSEPEIEPIPTDLSKPPVRRMWAMPLLWVSTLVLGLATGAIFTTHFNKRERSRSPMSPNIAAVSRPAEMLQETTRAISVARQEKPAKKVPSQSRKVTDLNPPAIVSEGPLDFSPAERPSATPIPENPGSRDITQHSRAAAPIDLPLHSHTMLSELVIPATPVDSGELPVLSGDSTLNEPDLGPVRQAVDLAAKKTGTFVSKVGTSIKRVF